MTDQALTRSEGVAPNTQVSGKTINSATLKLYEYHSPSCSQARGVDVYRVMHDWDGPGLLDWPGAATGDRITGSTFVYCGGWASFDVKTAVANWSNNSWGNHGFMLRAASETDSNNWKRFRSYDYGSNRPNVVVDYTEPAAVRPGVPTGVTPTYNSVFGNSTTSPGTTSVQVSAIYTHPSGTPGVLGFIVTNLAGTQVWSGWTSQLLCNGCRGTLTLPGQVDDWYYAQAIGWDGAQLSSTFSPSKQWYFLDSRPNLPATNIRPLADAYVASPVMASATYLETWGLKGYVGFAVYKGTTPRGSAVWSPEVIHGSTGTGTLPNLAVEAGLDLYVWNWDTRGDPVRSGPIKLNIAAIPGTPSNIVSIAGPGAVHLKWSAPASNGADLLRYDFTAYEGSTIAGSRRCDGACSPSDGFVFDGLQPGRTYSFKASATNAIGTGPLSPAANANSVQSWLQYVPTVNAQPVPNSGVTISWQAELLATTYKVRAYRGSTPANGIPVQSTFVGEVDVLAATSTNMVAGLANGTAYHFTVTPTYLIFLGGPESLASEAVVPYGRPFPPAITSVSAHDSAATVYWIAPPAQGSVPGDNGAPVLGYTVKTYKHGQADPISVSTELPATTREYQATGLINGQGYHMTVTARNAAGDGPLAQSESFTPFGSPFEPESVAAFGGQRQTLVSWVVPDARDGVPGNNGRPITEWIVRVDPPCAPSPCPGSTGIPASANSATVTGLRPGRHYEFQVAAINEAGTGAFSEEAPTDTFVEAPGTPTFIGARARSATGELTASWTPPTELNGSMLTGYEIVIDPTCACSGRNIDNPQTQSSIITGLEMGTEYTFQVRATSSAGVGALSAEATVTVHFTPRVMSWNLKRGLIFGCCTPPDMYAFAEQILNDDVDVIGFQEMTEEQANTLGTILQMQVRWAESDDTPPNPCPWPFQECIAYGNAILSRFPIISTLTKPLPDAANEGDHPQRILQRISTVIPGGTEIYFYNTHLASDATDAERNAQAQTVLYWVNQDSILASHPFRPIFVCDCNADPWAQAVTSLTGEFVDTWAHGPRVAPLNPHGYTNNPELPTRRIDYVFSGTQSGFDVRIVRVDPQPFLSEPPDNQTYLSDHAAVIAEFYR